jgi:antitoxin FitA
MSSVLIRGLSTETIDRLKQRAARQRRSLQAELKAILEEAVERLDPVSMRELARKIRESNTKKNQTDSAALLREDRQR